MRKNIKQGDSEINAYVYSEKGKWGKIQLIFSGHDMNHDDAFGVRMTIAAPESNYWKSTLTAATTGLQGHQDERLCGFKISDIDEVYQDIGLEIFWENDNQERAIIAALEAVLNELKGL